MCFFILLFTGCSKDNDLIDENDAKKKTESIVGKWNLEKLVNQEIPGTTDTYTGKNGEWAEFKKDGTGSQRWDKGDGSFDLEPFSKNNIYTSKYAGSLKTEAAFFDLYKNQQ